MEFEKHKYRTSNFECRTMNQTACYHVIVVVLFCVTFGTTCFAQQDLLTAYPCGPDSMKGPLRKLIPQGAFGADFKPACVAHDACYDTPNSSKSNCDAKYLQDMYCACSQSTRPILCRMTARIMARATRKHGQSSFDAAQRIAKAS